MTTNEKDQPAVVRAAAVQASPVYMDLDGCVKKACDLIAQAASQECDLIAFPECWIPGYPFFVWLNTTAANIQHFVPYHKNSLVVGSEAYQCIAAAAAEHNIFVSMGASERDHGSLYIAQFLFDNNGDLISGRRKLKATHMERTVFGDGGGSDLEVVDSSIGRIGQLCCWEHLQPLSKYAMYSMHEQIHLAAWPAFSVYPESYALGPQLNNAASQLYAAEGQCFVVAPCGVISPEIIEQLVTNDEQDSLISAGGGYARIFGPDGRPLCEPLAPDEEGILVADLPLDMITIAKSFADPVGHYSRPDVARLRLNSGHQPCVEPLDEINRSSVELDTEQMLDGKDALEE
ncbi:MAG: carbon-nitrogen hydrolase family protein [Pseudomonadota bacterium]